MDFGSNKLYMRRVSVGIAGKAGTIDLEGLRINFNIEKTNEGSPNRATIKVYNLSDKTRSTFEEGGARIIVSAGYRDTFGVIFSGNITKAKQKKSGKSVVTEGGVKKMIEGVDVITEIDAGDGDNAYRNSVWHKGYPPGTTVRQVIDDLVNSFGLPKAIDESAIPDKQYANGFATEGYVRNVLNDICKTNDLEWSIQNEVLQIVSKKISTTFGAVLLTPETGLVGSPTKTGDGVEFDSLLQPGLMPGRNVKLESRYIKGLFKVRKVTHTGDSHDGDFLSKCEATRG